MGVVPDWKPTDEMVRTANRAYKSEWDREGLTTALIAALPHMRAEIEAEERLTLRMMDSKP